MRVAAAIVTFGTGWLAGMTINEWVDGGFIGAITICFAMGLASSKAFYWAYGERK